jgi:hypothetical protein
MEKVTIVTLIDVTETKQHRKEPGKELEIKQQQNFLTLLQTISMRVNPVYDRAPRTEFSDGTVYKFGSEIVVNQKVWIFDFYFDYQGGFTDSKGNPIGLLIEDLHLIPVIDELTESATLEIPVFDTKTDRYRNTIISFSSDK